MTVRLDIYTWPDEEEIDPIIIIKDDKEPWNELGRFGGNLEQITAIRDQLSEWLLTAVR